MLAASKRRYYTTVYMYIAEDILHMTTTSKLVYIKLKYWSVCGEESEQLSPGKREEVRVVRHCKIRLSRDGFHGMFNEQCRIKF